MGRSHPACLGVEALIWAGAEQQVVEAAASPCVHAAATQHATPVYMELGGRAAEVDALGAAGALLPHRCRQQQHTCANALRATGVGMRRLGT